MGPFTLLEVGFPGWVVRVCFTFNLNMPFDGCAAGALQPYLDRLPIAVICFSEETPVETSVPLKIFLFEPAWRFSGMPSSNPSQQCMEDDMIHMFERTTTRHVPMIVGPTTDLWVEFTNQIACRQVKPASNYSARAVQEGLHILLGRLYEQHPIGVSAHILA
jgi:hypothetical protein